jgi:hypothetical protein
MSRTGDGLRPRLMLSIRPKGIDQMTDTETNTLPVWFVVIAGAALSLILSCLDVSKDRRIPAVGFSCDEIFVNDSRC